MSDIKVVQDALDSIKAIVSHEVDTLIDMEPDLKDDRRKAESVKQELLSSVRKDLESVIKNIALLRNRSWERLLETYPDEFKVAAKTIAAGANSGPASSTLNNGDAPAPVCPPGFEEQYGVCVRVM